MPADILRIKMFETPESFAVEENQNRYDFGIRQSSMLVSMDSAIAYLMFLSSDEKYLQKSSARQKISVILFSVIIAINPCKCCN